MLRWFWNAARQGARVGVLAGAIVGLIAGLGGSLSENSLPALAALVADVFLLLIVMLPLMFYVSLNNADSPQQVQTLAAVAWLPAFLLSVIAFMMPVVMAPLLLGKGVTFENSADWYGQVFDQLVNWRIVLVAVVSALGFAAAAIFVRRP